MARPSAEDIDNFKIFSGNDYSFPSDTAIQFIQGAGGNIEQAVNNFFDNPNRYHNQLLWDDPNASAWQEDVFQQDRDGGGIGDGPPSFQIHGPDDSPSSLQPLYPSDSNAPTRPPSRISMRDSEQESGVLGSAGGKPFFGPATRDSYDPSKWALIPSSAAVEILLDPNPDQRQRDLTKGEPVFMKPLSNNDSLPSLITILGAIPLARDALGGGLTTTEDFGSDSEWWKGAQIQLSTAVHQDSQYLKQYWDLVEETHRLIAFLHSSNRSYGSVEPLSELKALSDVNTGQQAEFKTLTDRFLAAWSNAAAVLQLGDPKEIPFYTNEIKLGRHDEAAPPRSLYDGADEMLWAEDEDGASDQNYYLKQIPEVLVMRVINQDGSKSGLDMDIPESWYLDRYLEENVQTAKSMRKHRSQYKQQLQNIEERRKKYTQITHPKVNITASDLFASAIEYLKPAPAPSIDSDDEDGEDGDQLPIEPRCLELANQLAAVYQNVEEKLKDLDVEREKTLAEMAKLSLLLTTTDPATTESPKPTHRYNLRGISTGPKHHESFVLIDPDQAVNPGEPGQWWRLSYEYDSVSKEKTVVGKVLNAANATREVMLVYASENASKPRDFDLSGPLRKFVNTDNANFAQELADFEAAQADPPPYETVEPHGLPDAHWPTQTGTGGADWVPDPGSNMVSDAEYAINTQYETFQPFREGGDTRMGGASTEYIEHVEDVVVKREYE